MFPQLYTYWSFTKSVTFKETHCVHDCGCPVYDRHGSIRECRACVSILCCTQEKQKPVGTFLVDMLWCTLRGNPIILALGSCPVSILMGSDPACSRGNGSGDGLSGLQHSFPQPAAICTSLPQILECQWKRKLGNVEVGGCRNSPHGSERWKRWHGRCDFSEVSRPKINCDNALLTLKMRELARPW